MKKDLNKRIEDKDLKIIKYGIILSGVLIILVQAIFGYFIITKLDKLNEPKEKILYRSSKVVFLGDSITSGFDLDKYFDNDNYINKGVSGYRTADIIKELRTRVFDYEPDKLFLLIGTNDIEKNVNDEEIIDNIKYIITQIQKYSPNTKIYIESIYPVNRNIEKLSNAGFGRRENNKIKQINNAIKELCKDVNVTYINMYDELLGDNEELNFNYTEDGLHLNDKGYKVVSKVLEKYL